MYPWVRNPRTPHARQPERQTMSQCFMWVNFSKKQFLQNEPFPGGLKYLESCYTGSVKTDAVHTLLAGDWKGDLVVFCGDYLFDLEMFGVVTRQSHPGLARVLDVAIDPVDIEYEFEDITGRFTYACGKTGWTPSIDPLGKETMVKTPYEGPFDLEIVHYRFVVNETKGIYYDRETTQNCFTYSRFDPLPLLLGTTWGRLLVNREPIAAPQGSTVRCGPDGLWVGEVICPTNERPGDGYVDVSALYTLALR